MRCSPLPKAMPAVQAAGVPPAPDQHTHHLLAPSPKKSCAASGFDMVIYANQLLRASYAAMQKTCGVILENCRSLETEAVLRTGQGRVRAVGFCRRHAKGQEQAAAVQPRVIIPAAGRPEPELLEHFGGLPASAIELKGKTVLQRQLATLPGAGLRRSAW